MGISEDFAGLIRRMSDSFIRDYSYMANKTVLARALRNAEEESREKVLRNQPEAEAAELRRLMAEMGDLGPAEAEAAQREIISMAAPYV
jgi:flagellar motor switch protein FliG